MVDQIRVPVLMVAGTKDDVCPVGLAREAVARIGPKARLIERPHAHIELHRHGADPENLKPVIEFLQASCLVIFVDPGKSFCSGRVGVRITHARSTYLLGWIRAENVASRTFFA
ncbi:hypothetical protein Vretimale_17750 [Volvox reticuliferus]|uniref:Serine aminopeptidase S33 domain-containing protein n=1 Tax=Volvox reticuliferus TaxID=1737510 RepID=A0A8J4CWU3_9CHLO|nr:hypothetical protein Vretifemale_18945 [Volvox reticuliferus]GIM14908.1 hypothetical protein Vretimale_17750 [Volvox reticuliferus]